MERQKFKDLISNLKQYDVAGDAWLNTVPRAINSAFFDNPYVDSLLHSRDLLLHALFEKPLRDEVEWFLYEWDGTKDESLRTITFPDGSKFVINNINDFVDYLVADGMLT
jgi:hypothetical protein